MPKILITGAFGQIGSELTLVLRERYGAENVVAAGHKTQPNENLKNGPIEFFDVTKQEEVEQRVARWIGK